MKTLFAILIIAVSTCILIAQSIPQKIYNTEKTFEKMVAEKGLNQGFIEFLSPTGIMFLPEAVNGREAWKLRPASTAALTWNPVWIDVSANGALAYSIGNSIYRPKGAADTNEIYGHYLTVWARQLNGEYLAALDIGINHEKPALIETSWKFPKIVRLEEKEKKASAGDSSIGFFQTAEMMSLSKAYKMFLAEDAYVLRDGKLPFAGRKSALSFLERERSRVKFAKRKSFIETSDLAYLHSTYSLADKNGVETEKGNFVQIWKLQNGKWMIAADVFLAIPGKTK
ncbi:MAG: nuclear transport factor 2 family protein [Acidobacteriota bacterium]|nr:nuclear transport factor 2 family protein [Acidobacteriota bacterium]